MPKGSRRETPASCRIDPLHLTMADHLQHFNFTKEAYKMTTKTNTTSNTTNETTTKCATCKKPGRIESMMKTAEGAFYHQGCKAPASAARDEKIKSIANRKAVDVITDKLDAKVLKSINSKKPATKKAAAKKSAKPVAKKAAKPAAKKASVKRDPNPMIAKTGNPFPGTGLIGPAFEMARKGCTLKALEAFCTKNKIGFARIKWLLRKEEHKGITWTANIDKKAGTVKLTVKSGASKAPKAA
jgi:hypothetical protein